MASANLKFRVLFIVACALFVQSCKEDVAPVNEEEVINEIKVTLRDEANTTYQFSYIDSDGDGPNTPLITSDDLPANKVLTGSITFENTLNTPVESITEEILEEGAVHQLFYLFSGSSAPNVKYDDLDINGKPIGLQFTLNTGSAYSGTLNVVLRHQPNKSATNVSTGDITNAGGESDVDISFNVVVK